MVQMMAVLEWMSQIYIPKTLNPNESPAAGEMVQMMAVLELPPRLACSIRVSLLSLNGTWLLPCTRPCHAHYNI